MPRSYRKFRAREFNWGTVDPENLAIGATDKPGHHRVPQCRSANCRSAVNPRGRNAHLTLIVFTACYSFWPSLRLYSRPTVNLPGAGKGRRRWRSAVAAAAALSVLLAVTTGWAARGSGVAAAVIPYPAAMSQGNAGVGAGHGRLQRDDHSHPAIPLARGDSTGSWPTHQAKNTWMTRDRPPTWNRLAPQSVRTPLSDSFAAPLFEPGSAVARAPTAAPIDDDIVTQLCIARC